MIKELTINNLAIIKDMNLEFNENFSSLTGETGAGKSIILDGLSLITGSRADTSVIRQGEDKLQVEALIELKEELKLKLEELYYDIDFSDNELIVRREITQDSKSKISINGKRQTLNTLSQIMENVVDIVGQHENQYLLNKKYHRELLDAFIDTKKYGLKELVEKLKKLNSKIQELEEEKQNIIEKKDLYEFSISEIDKYDLYEGLDEELEKEYKKSFNAGRINEAMEEIDTSLNEIILPALKTLTKKIVNLTEFSNVSYIKERLDDAKENINEVLNNIEIDEEDYDIEKISEKLNYINKLKLKYADSIKGLIEYKKELISKLEKLAFSDEEIKKYKEEKEKIIKSYLENSEKLSNERREFAKKLEKEIDNELLELNMKEAKFIIKFEKKEGFLETGTDDIEFMIKTNKGQDYSKLTKVASGGEVSRIMLALKIVFSKVDNLSSLIFDEIDAGISGETSKLVAKKLKELSKNVQVICVTHSPNIAAISSEQFLISKKQEDENTVSSIRKLDKKERIEEIARIISGDNITDSLRNFVLEMMDDNNG